MLLRESSPTENYCSSVQERPPLQTSHLYLGCFLGSLCFQATLHQQNISTCFGNLSLLPLLLPTSLPIIRPEIWIWLFVGRGALWMKDRSRSMWILNFCDCWISDYVKAKNENCLRVWVYVCWCVCACKRPDSQKWKISGLEGLNTWTCTGLDWVSIAREWSRFWDFLSHGERLHEC